MSALGTKVVEDLAGKMVAIAEAATFGAQSAAQVLQDVKDAGGGEDEKKGTQHVEGL